MKVNSRFITDQDQPIFFDSHGLAYYSSCRDMTYKMALRCNQFILEGDNDPVDVKRDPPSINPRPASFKNNNYHLYDRDTADSSEDRLWSKVLRSHDRMYQKNRKHKRKLKKRVVFDRHRQELPEYDDFEDVEFEDDYDYDLYMNSRDLYNDCCIYVAKVPY